MYKGTIEITNKGLGFKLINSPSFGESAISVRFIKKTVKRDLFVKRNHRIMPWHLRGKDLEDTRGHHTVAEPKGLPPVCYPVPCGPTCQPASRRFLHRILGLHLRRSLSPFDPRIHVVSSGLYKQAPAPSLELS
jgi:hypothetical protein